MEVQGERLLSKYPINWLKFGSNSSGEFLREIKTFKSIPEDKYIYYWRLVASSNRMTSIERKTIDLWGNMPWKAIDVSLYVKKQRRDWICSRWQWANHSWCERLRDQLSAKIQGSSLDSWGQSQRDFQRKQGSMLYKTRTMKKHVNLYGRFLSDNFWYKKKNTYSTHLGLTKQWSGLGPCQPDSACPKCGVWNGLTLIPLCLHTVCQLGKHHSFPLSLYTCLQIYYYIK